VGISGVRQLVIRGDSGTGFYQSVGVFANGTMQLSNNHCYFNKINFPFSTTSDGITGYEKKTSTLLHCAGTLVSTRNHTLEQCFLTGVPKPVSVSMNLFDVPRNFEMSLEVQILPFLFLFHLVVSPFFCQIDVPRHQKASNFKVKLLLFLNKRIFAFNLLHS